MKCVVCTGMTNSHGHWHLWEMRPASNQRMKHFMKKQPAAAAATKKDRKKERKMTTTKKERFGMQIYLAKTMYIKSISFLRPPSASNPRIPFFAQSTLYGFGVCVFRLFNNLALSVPVTVCVWVCVRFFFATLSVCQYNVYTKKEEIYI